MMRDQHLKEFFDRVLPGRPKACEARWTEVKNARVGSAAFLTVT
jgi:hypothetical protein